MGGVPPNNLLWAIGFFFKRLFYNKMPDIMYLLFIFILMYLCCIPRFDMGGPDPTVGPAPGRVEGFNWGDSPHNPLFY